ncbi:MAG: T9SS type A sorting domain-containing protein [Bacteroidota bacterium]|nr:T9SS type A sorting domain-containing protein [Bacteroidota bacterium]
MYAPYPQYYYSSTSANGPWRSGLLLCWLWLLLAAVPTWAQPVSQPVGALSLAPALAADGTLRAGASGSFDARGFTFDTAPDGHPVFRPAAPNGADDYKWQGGFGLPEGINGSPIGSNVKTVLQVGSDVYIGGNFTAAGGTAANFIARWDGSRWRALGTGPANGLNGFVRALAVAPNGDLYAGGDFTRAGGVVANGIARWNGSTWSALGTGTQNGVQVNSGVYAIAVVANGDVYAGGNFYQAGSQSVTGLARWNGTAWSTVGGGLSSYAEVRALAFDATGSLYVGGSFASAGGSAAAGIARWSGSAWSSLGGGVRNSATSPGTVEVLAVAATGDVYIGGGFGSVSGQPANNVARWNGTSWSALGTGTSNTVYGLAVSPGGEVFVGGYLIATAGGVPISGVARWDGTAWSSVGPAAGARPLYVTCLWRTSGGDLYAGGELFELGGTRLHGLGRWNGTAWVAVGTGQGNGVYGEVQAVAVAANGDVYVGGRFDQVGTVPAHNVARWNGTSWSALGTGTANGVGAAYGGVDALAFAPNGDLYVGGYFNDAGGQQASSIARWNGTTWGVLADASGYNGIDNGRAYALVVAPNGDLYVGGGFNYAGSMLINNVVRWNGTTWQALGAGIRGGNVLALALGPNGEVYAGGSFVAGNGNATGYLLRWNGSTWNGVGSGVNGVVLALAVASSGDLYAGGQFTSAGGAGANGVARWNGTTWNPLGLGAANGVLLPGGTYPGVSALAFGPGGQLYVGGNFTQAGGGSANYLATWNGTTWSGTAFGSGLNNTVRTLVLLPGGKLCVGGYFAGVGDTSKPLVDFGIFDPAAVPTATVAGTAAALAPAIFPNPAHATTTVAVPAVPGVATATLTILDAVGRTLRTQTAPTNAPAELNLTGLAPGLYAVRVQAGAAIATQRLVVE